MKQFGLLLLVFSTSAFADLPEEIICVGSPSAMGMVYVQPDYKNNLPWALVYQKTSNGPEIWFNTTFTAGRTPAEGTFTGVTNSEKGVLTILKSTGIGRYEGSFSYFDGTNSSVYPVKCEIPD